MKTRATIQGLLLFGVASFAACKDGDTEQDGTTGDTTAGTADGPDTLTSSTSSTSSTTADDVDSTSSTTADDVDSTSSSSSDTTSSSSSDTTSSSSSSSSDTTTGGDEFEFREDPYDEYVQIDRHGAVEAGTAGILASQGLGFAPGSDIALRDEYNASNPAEDASGTWVPESFDSVSFFHNALDDDLMGLALTPATVDQSLVQAGPVIVPDTIKYDPGMPTSYPNGRALTDQAVDITLAAVLLDLGTHGLTTFADLPLNPPENDVLFLDDFPYLAAPHAP